MNSSRSDVKRKIDSFFDRKTFSSTELKKVRTLAMKHRIRLGIYRTRFCKKCLTDLKDGLLKITETYRTTTCPSCGYKNKVRIS